MKLHRLSHKLVLGMALFTALGLIVAFSVINTLVRDIVYDNVLESTLRDRMIQAQQMDAWFKEAVQIIANLSETLPLVDRTHYQDVVVHYLARYYFIQAIWVTMEDGGFYDSGFWVPPYWFYAQERDWWVMAAARNGEVITTPPYISASTGEVWTALSRHTRDWGGQEVAVSMAIELSRLETMISDFQARTVGYLMLTTPDGGFVIHPNPEHLPLEDGLHTIQATMSEIPGYAEVFALFAAGENVVEYVDQHGTPSYFMQFLIPSTGWYLIAVVPKTVTSIPVWQMLSAVIFTIALVLAVVMLFSFVFLSRRFVRPIESLTASVSEVAAGNLNVSIDSLSINNISAKHTDEIGDLSKAIGNMLREIDLSHKKEREARHEIEHREKLLNAANQAATVLLTANESDNMDAIMNGTAIMGSLLAVDRAQIWHHKTVDGEIIFELQHEWVSKLGKEKKPFPKSFVYSYDTHATWLDALVNGEYMNGTISVLPPILESQFKEYGVVSIALIPMFIEKEIIGFLSVHDCKNARTFSKDEIDILTTVGLMFTSVYNRSQQRLLAYTDALTNLYNRRYFEESSQREFNNCIKEDRDFSIIMTDIDHFKSVNDCYGHAIGDEVLKIFAARIRRVLKQDTLVARYGGEEFVVVLSGAGHGDALKTAWRLNKTIQDSAFRINDMEIKVTASFGVASKTAGRKTMMEIVNNADKSLYEAKANGRNTVAG